MLTLFLIQMLGQDILPTISNYKNCLFCATNIVEKSDKEKLLYSGYGIAFDRTGSWNFGNDFARNV